MEGFIGPSDHVTNLYTDHMWHLPYLSHGPYNALQSDGMLDLRTSPNYSPGLKHMGFQQGLSGEAFGNMSICIGQGSQIKLVSGQCLKR